jgi:hypothetical protein
MALEVGMDRTGGLSAIGNTPVVRLARMAGDSCAEVWVKMEAANPTGSYKDRMALAMIEAAEADGRLRPGQPVVEYTGGSTGSSLAFVCAVKGYPLRIVSSDAFAEEKILTMRAFGADVELIPSPDGITPGLIPSMTTSKAAASASARLSCIPPTTTRSSPSPRPGRSPQPARPPATRASSPGHPPARTSLPRWISPAGSVPATAWSPFRSTAA